MKSWGWGVMLFLLATSYQLLATDLWAMERIPLSFIEKNREGKNVDLSPLPMTLTLEDCYRLALKQSETIAIKREDIEEVQAQFYKAAGVALGDVDFVMTHFRQDPQDRMAGSRGGDSEFGSNLSRERRRERKFVIQQPLFQGFKTVAALSAAGSLTKQKREEKIRAEQLLFLEVAEAFYRTQAYKKNIKRYEEVLKLYKERVQELDGREKIGRTRPSEVVTVRSQMKINEAELAHARGLLADSIHILEFLTGVPIDVDSLQDDDVVKENLETLNFYLTSASERPDVEAAYQAMKSYWSGVIDAQSGLWPQIGLENNYYEKREGSQEGIDWDLLFRVDVPIFKGGETAGKIKESVSKWKKAKLTYARTQREAELDIKEAYENWKASLDEYKAYEEATKAADENFKLQQEDYNHSLVSNLDVLVALESMFNTKREAIRVYYEMKQNYWRLQVAMGKLEEKS